MRDKERENERMEREGESGEGKRKGGREKERERGGGGRERAKEKKKMVYEPPVHCQGGAIATPEPSIPSSDIFLTGDTDEMTLLYLTSKILMVAMLASLISIITMTNSSIKFVTCISHKMVTSQVLDIRLLIKF